MSSESLQSFPGFQQRIVKLNNITEALQAKYGVPSGDALFEMIMNQWQDEIPKMDRGLNDPAGNWASFEVDTNGWNTMELPNNWENEGLPGLDGIVWFRKEVDIPSSWIELSTPALNPYNPNFPTLLSNAMIEPLIPYAIRGVIWYQGEANAGEDRVFRWAEASIDGDTVILWHPQIKNPVAGRYAWASNPICNLYNSASLPASPFRTDDWPGITEH